MWVPSDFTVLGSRGAVDQALHRLTRAELIRRITHGLYDKPSFNSLTGKPINPDPRAVIDALARRDSARMMVDGITTDRHDGLSTLPIWMQIFLRDLIAYGSITPYRLTDIGNGASNLISRSARG